MDNPVFEKDEKSNNVPYSSHNGIPQDKYTTLKENGVGDTRVEYIKETTNNHARKNGGRYIDDSNIKDTELQVTCSPMETKFIESTRGYQAEDGDMAKVTKGEPKIMIQRTVFSQKNFNENFESGLRPSPSLQKLIKKSAAKCLFSKTCMQWVLNSIFPFIFVMKNYNIKTDLLGDLVAGLTVGIMHIPQGLAYGLLTTLPAVYGLYASFFPVLVYYFFGSSRHISMGTFAVSCIMVGTAVSKGYDSVYVAPAVTSGTNNSSNTTSTASTTMSATELDLRLQFAMSVSFVAGVVQLAMGLLKLGFVTVYLSDALLSAFTTGVAVQVFVSLIKDCFAVKTGKYVGVFKLVYMLRDFFNNIRQQANYVTIIVSAIVMISQYLVSRLINENPKVKAKLPVPVPIELIVVIVSTAISYGLNLNGKYNVVIVGKLPLGLPAPSLHAFTRIGSVIGEGIALGIVVFAIAISMAKILSKKYDYEVNANQELIAYGMSTIISALFKSVAPSVSLARSIIQESVGGKTQVAGLFSCCLLLIVLLAIGPYFKTLPNAVLSSILIISLRRMFMQIFELELYWKVSTMDFWVWVVTFLGTIFTDIDLGLGIAVGFNILTIAFRSQRPYITLLGRMGNTDIYRDINVYPDAKEVPGIKIVRFEHSLFFVNIDHFRNQLYKRTVNLRTLRIRQKKRQAKLAKQQKKMESMGGVDVEKGTDLGTPNTKMNGTTATENKKPSCPPDIDFHTVILDCSTWGFVDLMGVTVLASIVAEFQTVGVQVLLANCKAGLQEMFERANFYKTLDHEYVYVQLHDAVLAAVHERLQIDEDYDDLDDDDSYDVEFSSYL